MESGNQPIMESGRSVCGVYGALTGRGCTTRLTPSDPLLNALHHRGPDGRGWHVSGDGRVVLGHTRLAIIDRREVNAQPLTKGGLTITYNGELYNYRELRTRLQGLGYSFVTDGDTEVVLEAWRQWGPEALDRFDGMYAFALLADGASSIELVRDPFGEKPLYWAETGQGVSFASEPQVLIDTLGLPFSPSLEEQIAFLGLGFLPEPHTGYTGLQAVPPGSIVTLRPDQPPRTRRYWQPPLPSVRGGRVADVSDRELDRVRDLLATSLERRLRADVPLGLFLSGGVDSTLVAALAARELGVDVKALTVAFTDGVDESPRARRIAAALDLNHVVVDSEEDESWREGTRAIRDLFGVPNDNYSALAVRQISRAARSHMTVALGGTGGDEIFYGYGRHHFAFEHRRAYRLLPTIVDGLGPLGDLLLGSWSRWQAARELFPAEPDWQFLALKNRQAVRAIRSTAGPGPVLGGLLRDAEPGLAVLIRDADLRLTLPGSYLAAMDRGSMSESLEMRTPYLSRELLEHVTSFDQRALLAHGHKHLQRRLLGRYLPPGLVDPGKQGFTLPTDRFLTALPRETPPVPGLSEDMVESAWRRRTEPAWSQLAVRLAVLSDFANRSATVRT